MNVDRMMFSVRSTRDVAAGHCKELINRPARFIVIGSTAKLGNVPDAVLNERNERDVRLP
jgi:hypothetical protein